MIQINKEINCNNQKEIQNINKQYSEKEILKIKEGILASAEKEKWNAFFESNTLFIIQNGLGREFYRVTFEKNTIKKIMINKDINLEKPLPENVNIDLCLWIIDYNLLDKNVSLPIYFYEGKSG